MKQNIQPEEERGGGNQARNFPRTIHQILISSSSWMCCEGQQEMWPHNIHFKTRFHVLNDMNCAFLFISFNTCFPQLV